MNLHYYLKKGGYLILGVPQEGVFMWRLRNNYLQPSIMKATDHVHFYSKKELKGILIMSDFNRYQCIDWRYGLPITVLDNFVRRSKMLYNLVNFVGRWAFPSQAIGLYFICIKQ